MTTMQKIITGTAAIAAVLVAVALITSSRSRAGSQTGLAAPVAVEVQAVSSDPISETVTAVGTVSATRDVVVSSETAGRITAVFFKVGDRVQAGQTLVQVDDELKAIGVEQANAQLLAAETNYRKAERDYQRSEKLLASRDIADAELEAYRLGLHAAEAQWKAAQAGLKYAQRQLDDARIKAPISGLIASKRVEVGEMVVPGREVANIVDMSAVRVRLTVPEEDIGKLRVRQPATLRVDADPGVVFSATVYSVGTKTESPMEHSYPVEVVVEKNAKASLKVGMFARVAIEARSLTNALTISKASLVGDDGNPQIYVVVNDTAKLRSVTLGIRAGEKVQVIDGVREGDLVISFGQKNVKDGARVQYRVGS